jgi:fructose-specific component phosphotransferase system IIB-like protein
MTLRNMLATPARKNGKLVGLNGEEVAIDLPKPALTGAAAKAKDAAAEAVKASGDGEAATGQF